MAYVYQVRSGKRRGFFSGLSINSIIILINLVCFILFSILIASDVKFLDYIALKPSSVLQAKYVWTFLTSMFMHAGFFHLLVNMLSLFFIGSLIERILGHKRYLWIYMAGGLFAGLFFVLSSLLFADSFNTYAVGASGALFGLIGLLMLLTPNLPVYVMFIPIPIKIKYAAPGILILLWVISALGDVPIGNTAHLGGLLLGLGYGIYLRKKYKNKIQYISRRFS